MSQLKGLEIKEIPTYMTIGCRNSINKEKVLQSKEYNYFQDNYTAKSKKQCKGTEKVPEKYLRRTRRTPNCLPEEALIVSTVNICFPVDAQHDTLHQQSTLLMPVQQICLDTNCIVCAIQWPTEDQRTINPPRFYLVMAGH